DFFLLGGHSLRAAIMAAKIHKIFNVHIPLIDIFSAPTIIQLAQRIDNAPKKTFSAVPPAEKREYYPLSSAQKRLFITHQLAPHSLAYNLPNIVVLEGDLQEQKLEDAFKQLIAKHDSFRTAFISTVRRPVQVVKPREETTFIMKYDDFTSHPHEEAVTRLVEDFVRPFDLQHPPLLRAGLVKILPHMHILMVDMHHIISDGTSMGLLVSQLARLYEGNELPTIPLQYKDFALWQNRMSETGETGPQKLFWLNQFKGNIPALNLPVDYPESTNPFSGGGVIPFQIQPRIAEKAKQLVIDTNTTLFTLLLTIFDILLSKYAGHEDIVVGTPVAGRNHTDLQLIIGMFVNMLPLRSRPGKTKTFREFLQETWKYSMDAFENQDYPFDDLVATLGLQGSGTANPLFDVVFTLQNTETGETHGSMDGPLTISPYAPGILKSAHDRKENEDEESPKASRLQDGTMRFAKFHLLLAAVETGDGIQLNLEYANERFSEETAGKITGFYLDILNQVLEDRDIRLEDIQLTHSFAAIDTQSILEDDDEFQF
ncbi:MAG: beta-ketoacyl synthase, partial [bacterium]|nr:beta-ketoacyl synthase [bacterium]